MPFIVDCEPKHALSTVPFDFQLAQKIGQHVAELRMTKEPLQLPVILGFLQELTSHVTLGTDVQPWDVIGMFVTRLSNDVNALLPQVQQSVTDQRLITSKSFTLNPYIFS